MRKAIAALMLVPYVGHAADQTCGRWVRKVDTLVEKLGTPEIERIHFALTQGEIEQAVEVTGYTCDGSAKDVSNLSLEVMLSVCADEPSLYTDEAQGQAVWAAVEILCE